MGLALTNLPAQIILMTIVAQNRRQFLRAA